MAIYCTTEEAREYISHELPVGLELPRNTNFNTVKNHCATAVIFAALGEPEQTHNLSQLYSAFAIRSPGWADVEFTKNDSKRIRENIRRRRDSSEQDANLRLADGREENQIEAFRFILANAWKLEDDLVDVYAVDAQGTIAKVTTMGGWVDLEDFNWHWIAESIESGIKREFNS